MFIDKAVIEIQSGKGGDGAIAFIHEKFRPNGGPSGGNGGRGGSVYFRATRNETSLINFKYTKKFFANDGEKGDIKNQYGRKAEDIYIDVPVGTVVFLESNHQFICDLSNEGDTFLICKGGRGGRGNACFKNSRNKAPKIAENGLPGEKKKVILELKLLADVGIIGLPSVGKSTFISCVSNSKAEIGDYDFTTLVPNLGVVRVDEENSFVLADMPGLIEGAHLGKGLGLTFLRHIERTRVLIHMIDMGSERDPYQDYLIVRKELENYGMNLIDRPEIIVASKMDEENALKRLEEFKNKVKKEVFPISAITDEGIQKVLYKCVEELKDAPTYPIYNETEIETIYNLEDDNKLFEIEKEKEGVFKIVGDRVIRTYRLINLSTEEGLMRLLNYLNKIGIDEALKEAGAKDGDTVILDDFMFDYFE